MSEVNRNRTKTPPPGESKPSSTSAFSQNSTTAGPAVAVMGGEVNVASMLSTYWPGPSIPKLCVEGSSVPVFVPGWERGHVGSPPVVHPPALPSNEKDAYGSPSTGSTPGAGAGTFRPSLAWSGGQRRTI